MGRDLQKKVKLIKESTGCSLQIALDALRKAKGNVILAAKLVRAQK